MRRYSGGDGGDVEEAQHACLVDCARVVWAAMDTSHAPESFSRSAPSPPWANRPDPARLRHASWSQPQLGPGLGVRLELPDGRAATEVDSRVARQWLWSINGRGL